MTRDITSIFQPSFQLPLRDFWTFFIPERKDFDVNQFPEDTHIC